MIFYKKILTAFVCLFLGCVLSVSAQKGYVNSGIGYPKLGVRIGTDLGAAMPFPLKFIPSKMSPEMRPQITLGITAALPLSEHFSIGLEAMYKKIDLSAGAMVQNQRFTDNSDPANPFITYFSGQAEMQMMFTILEFPLYMRWEFTQGKNALLFGGYYGWVMDASFDTVAKKGMMGATPDDPEATILKDPQIMPFTDFLDTWDAGVTFGYRRQIIRRMFVDLKVCVGLKSIFTPDFDGLEYKMYPIRGSFGLSYDIFDFNN